MGAILLSSGSVWGEGLVAMPIWYWLVNYWSLEISLRQGPGEKEVAPKQAGLEIWACVYDGGIDGGLGH